LKEILSKKRKIDEHETVALGKEYTIVVLNQLPAKLKNTGSFSITCIIRNVSIDRALCDLGSTVSLMPYSIFKKLSLGELRTPRISVQLVNRSIKYPMGILKDVPIKVGSFYVLIDFVALHMAEDPWTQIILGRTFLATARCKIDVKEGKLTFDVGEPHAEFGLFKGFEFSPSTFSCCGCEIVDSDEPMDELDITLNDPFGIDCTLFEGVGLDDVKVDSFPPNIVEIEPYAVDKGYLSTCCRFVTLWMFMPPMSGGVHEMDADFEFYFGPYDSDGPKMSMILDPTLWRILRTKKDINPNFLRVIGLI